VAEAKSPTLVVCDAGPLIHLDELGCLDLLADFQEVVVPDAVWEEVSRHRPSALGRRKLKLQRLTVTAQATSDLTKLAQDFSLAAGEMEALLVMAERPDAVLLTDDAAARLVADNLGYEVHGTIGVVVRALRREQRTKRQVLNLLRSIPRKSTLHISGSLLDSVIEQIRAT
jgi:predicted nucleic acid-binding protein